MRLYLGVWRTIDRLGAGLIIRDDASSVGEYIGEYIAKRYACLRESAGGLTDGGIRIRDFKPTAEKPFVLGLPTGSSPIPTYKYLIKLVKAGTLSYALTKPSA